MQNSEQFETLMKSALNVKVDDVLPSDDMFIKIKEGIELDRSEPKMIKGNFFKSNFSVKKVLAVGLCCTVLLAGSAFAANYINKHVRGFLTEKEYKTLPSKAEIKKDAGFAAKMPEVLPGGFKLNNANLAGYIDGASQSKEDDKRKVFSVSYKKPDGNADSFLTLSASNDENETKIGKDPKTVYICGKEAHYWKYTLHVIPYDKKMSGKNSSNTKDDGMVEVYVSSKKGSSEKLTERFVAMKALKWKDNNISYVLTDNGYKLSQDELAEMAKAVINSK